jgi:hypothetical protein
MAMGPFVGGQIICAQTIGVEMEEQEVAIRRITAATGMSTG